MRTKPAFKQARLEPGIYERIVTLKKKQYARMSISGIVNCALDSGLKSLEQDPDPRWRMAETKSSR